MDLFVGVTDIDWFRYLAAHQPDEVNFWRPSAVRFGALNKSDPFLFKLKSPINKIAGGGFFVHYIPLPLSLAWEVFERRNGADDYTTFRQSILSHMRTLHPDPEIGCLVLTQPVFLDEDDWIDAPPDWQSNIVSGKAYNTESRAGAALWQGFQDAVQYTQLRYLAAGVPDAVVVEAPRYGEDYLARARLGQGGFRSLVTEAYQRRCAMTGERTLPVLQASHIKPYVESGPHRVDNGLLLRADLHILFDRGYVTVTPDYHIEVSQRIKEEFENGRDYYQMHGQKLRVLPGLPDDRPSPAFIEWHNAHVYEQ